MFFHLQYIHLFRPFLKYNPSTSPLPSHVSPRRICTTNAAAISKLMRLYKKTYNLRQICNIAVYMVHSACTIHMLNLPERTARRDITHGFRQLEEIAEDWLCARRTLCILSVLARKWKVELPEDAAAILQNADEKYGTFSTSDVPSPHVLASISPSPPSLPPSSLPRGGDSLQQPQRTQFDRPEPYTQPPSRPQQQLPAEQPITDVTMFPDIAANLALASGPAPPPPGNLQSQAPGPAAHPAANSSLPMADAGVPPLPPWTIPQVPQTTTSYMQYLTPSTSSSAQDTRAGTRQVSPGSLFTVDDQDWFLKDGANWQQNFESWDLGSPTSASGVGVSAGGGNAPGLDATSNPGPMYTFAGFRGDYDAAAALDSLNNSMNSLDHLSGLD